MKKHKWLKMLGGRKKNIEEFVVTLKYYLNKNFGAKNVRHQELLLKVINFYAFLFRNISRVFSFITIVLNDAKQEFELHILIYYPIKLICYYVIN